MKARKAQRNRKLTFLYETEGYFIGRKRDGSGRNLSILRQSLKRTVGEEPTRSEIDFLKQVKGWNHRTSFGEERICRIIKFYKKESLRKPMTNPPEFRSLVKVTRGDE